MSNHSSIDKILLHFSLIPGVGPSLVGRLLSTLGVDQLPKIYTYSVNEVIQKTALSERYARLLVDGLADTRALEQELVLLEQNGFAWLSLVSQEYPQLLRHIYSPPIGLYVWGSTHVLHQKSVGIVGSRLAGLYAERVINSLIPPLVEHNMVIVSGGARGVDGMAHKATCDAGGATVVVLGSGLLRLYPASNRKLFERVVQTGGALVSTFPLQTIAAAHNFPARNRVIAGIAQGCVVVQAAQKSGAKITASLALQEGREVFAVPGSIFDQLSIGCHELLSQGATLVSSAADILRQFGYNPRPPKKQESMQQDIFVDKQQLEEKLDGVLAYCAEPISFDDLKEKTNYDTQKLQDELFDLQCSGKIEQNFLGLWQIK